MKTLETVTWQGGAVRLLDQRALPDEECYLEVRTVPDLVEAIRTLAVRGAPAIGVAGAMGLAMVAAASRAPAADTLLDEIRRASETLGNARPTAVNLGWALSRTVRRLESLAMTGASAAELRAQCLAEAQTIRTEDLDLSDRMARAGAELLPARGRVLTHCNTGGLATAGGGTALGVVLEAARQGKEL
ncbi:MAG: S-methyl-5-thioribose-1-phosphate isomerase, partial [Candidatus Eisenbacteria bacterium]|nr:S-methyl-5-thioribose-1-phosphate isomerase [Candidatus Eisenbacteria bacterium]